MKVRKTDVRGHAQKLITLLELQTLQRVPAKINFSASGRVYYSAFISDTQQAHILLPLLSSLSGSPSMAQLSVSGDTRNKGR